MVHSKGIGKHSGRADGAAKAGAARRSGRAIQQPASTRGMA
jgi:hypothetical protein